MQLHSTMTPCACGCGKPAANGQRYAPSHNGRIRSVAARFWKKVNKDGPNGCWLWTGSCDDHGYGRMMNRRVSNSPVHASRVSWELHYGPIPEGQKVCHTCDNPPCVNPEHLFLGTQEQNQRDMARKKRDRWPSKITQADALAIRIAYAAGGITYRELGERYGVNVSTVCDILKRRTWNRS